MTLKLSFSFTSLLFKRSTLKIVLYLQTINENAKLKAELERLQQRLEDERQKVEDLMFRNEEENINKEDYQVTAYKI